LNLQGLLALARPDAPTYRGGLNFPLMLLQIILPVVPFLAALLLSFGRFDVRRSRRFSRRYGIVFAVSLALCALAASAAADAAAPKYFRLTQNLKLIEWKYGSRSMRIRGPESSLRIRIESLGLWSGWDDGSSLFAWDYGGRLNRIDLETGKIDPLHQFDRKQLSYWRPRTYGSVVVFLDNGPRPDEIQLIALNLKTKETVTTSFTYDGFRAGTPELVGTDVRDGKRFWICRILWKTERSTLRLWEDGRIEEILVKGQLKTVNNPHLLNGLLFFTGQEPIIVLHDTGPSFEHKKEFPAEEIFQIQEGSFFFRTPLDDPPPSFIYGKRGPRLARMSLETLEIEDIGDWRESDDAWGHIHRHGDQAYFVGGSRSRKNLDVYGLSQAGPRLIRSFPGIDTQRRDTRFTIFDSGIVITQGRRFKVYAFPDLKEIEYR